MTKVPPGALYAEAWNGRWTMPGQGRGAVNEISLPTPPLRDLLMPRLGSWPLAERQRAQQRAQRSAQHCPSPQAAAESLPRQGGFRERSGSTLSVSANGGGIIASTRWLPWDDHDPLVELPAGEGGNCAHKSGSNQTGSSRPIEKQDLRRFHPYKNTGRAFAGLSLKEEDDAELSLGPGNPGQTKIAR